MKLHSYAQYLLTLPDQEVEVEVAVLERTADADQTKFKQFAAKVEILAQVDTEAAATDFARHPDMDESIDLAKKLAGRGN